MDKSLCLVNHYGEQLASIFIGQMEHQEVFLRDIQGQNLARFRLDISGQFQGSCSAKLKQVELVAQELLMAIFSEEKEVAIFEYAIKPQVGRQMKRLIGNQVGDRLGALPLDQSVREFLGSEDALLFWRLRRLNSVNNLKAMIKAKTYQDFPQFPVKKLGNPIVLLALNSQTLYYFYDDRGCELHFSNRQLAERIGKRYQPYQAAYQELLAKNSQ